MSAAQHQQRIDERVLTSWLKPRRSKWDIHDVLQGGPKMSWPRLSTHTRRPQGPEHEDTRSALGLTPQRGKL